MESQDAQSTLAGALGAAGRQLVAFVGAGGKTTALQRLTGELAHRGARILATTTTAMFASQLSSLGPLLLEDEDATPLATRAVEVLRGADVVALARARAAGGKVKGLPPAAVDALWQQRLVEATIVEADGSRGLSLKAFGAAEPQLPSLTTIVVVLAGLDAIGLPLDNDHVHRAEELTSILNVTPGDTVTPELLGAALALQVTRVRELAPRARVVVLLNKADDGDRAGRGAAAAAALLAGCINGASARPDRVVVGSSAQGVYGVMHG